MPTCCTLVRRRQEGTQTDDIDKGVQLGIVLTSTDTDIALRKGVSCSYFDVDLEHWSSRGMVLRGLDVTAGDSEDNAIVITAICVSSHLTVFSLEDDSEVRAVRSVCARYASV